MLADKTGLTSAWSDALYRPDVIHDRGAVMRDLAVSIADGATSICDIAVLGDQKRVFGPVASATTAWRALNELDAEALGRLLAARDRVRARVWELIEARHGKIPPVRTCYGDLDDAICVRIDATLITAYSDKESAAGNFKGGYGFHPLLAWCDNTGELLAVITRAGNAGSNTAADHIAIVDAAIAAIPAKHRRKLLIAIDGAGSSHAVIEHLTKLGARTGYTVEYSVGFRSASTWTPGCGPRWPCCPPPPGTPPWMPPAPHARTRRSSRSPACCATATVVTNWAPGRPGCASWCAANPSRPEPSCVICQREGTTVS
ncbi:MAG: transposase [Mycobacterium sp.]|nr:transposase [Mycobacterium sp.]